MFRFAFVLFALVAPAFAGERGMCLCGSQAINGEVGYFTVLRIADFEDGSSAWLTAGHCVDVGSMTLLDSKGVKYAASVVADSRPTGVPIANDAPDVALIKGPGFEDKFHFRLIDKAPRRAVVYSLVRERRKLYALDLEDSGTLWGNAKSEPGDSGSPVFEGDECYGLLVGCTSDQTECVLGFGGIRRCRLVSRGRIVFERSRTITRWLQTTTYQPCVPNAGNPIQPIPQPEPQPRPVGRANCDCEQQFAALRLRVEQLEARKLVAGPPGPAGPRGDVGAQGPAGRAGTVTVILEEDGKQLHKASDLLSGSTVRVPIRRTETKSTGSN